MNARRNRVRKPGTRGPRRRINVAILGCLENHRCAEELGGMSLGTRRGPLLLDLDTPPRTTRTSSLES